MSAPDEWAELIRLMNRIALALVLCVAAGLLFTLVGCTPGVVAP